MFKCIECGRKFKTVKAAEKAANKGCPGCGGVDIDLDTSCGSPEGTQPGSLPPTIKSNIGGTIVDYDDPPLRRRMLS